MVARENGEGAGPSHKPTNGSTVISTGGGLAASLDRSISSSRLPVTGDFSISADKLSWLSNERTRLALAETLEQGLAKPASTDPEAPSDHASMSADILKLVQRIKDMEASGPPPEHSPEEIEADKNAEIAASALASIVLRSSPETGISPSEVELRRLAFGTNAIAEKELDSFLKLCWEAIQDFVLIMLLILGVLTIIVETTIGNEAAHCTTCWIEGTAILVSVSIVVFVTAGIDYAKQFAFIRLTRSLNETNTKSVVRDGKLVSVVDDDIVVGDILSVNSHSLASIPADCVLLGPAADLRMDESALTGESVTIAKRPGDIVLSGTTAKQGTGKMVVVAVGVQSVQGRIKARVYDSEDKDDELDGEDENSPLFNKLDRIAKQIGILGTCAAAFAFIISCILGLVVQRESASNILDYLLVAITVLAVAVPEGLPLAVTLALAFSSSKMMREQNLVKHLDACETMGCATTICTDKTGTLTANKMTARALLMAFKDYLVEDPKVTLSDYIKTFDGGASDTLIELLCQLISIDTMDETVLYVDKKGKIEGASGNPTEVALLVLVNELGNNYEQIRNTTRGRSNQGHLAEFLAEGKQLGFSSARKMMSWIVPRDGGGYRLYCKGAQEVVVGRCSQAIGEDGSPSTMTEERKSEISSTALAYTRRGMRCLGLAYRDLPGGFDLEELSPKIKNSDGSNAFAAETDLVCLGIVGIEDPLRAEVPEAITKCYRAGIDVRLVTGDNPETAVSIAYQAGILRDEHFVSSERVSTTLKENVLMLGKDFRATVQPDGQFDQAEFDRIWPHLRVLARSSPDDKLTLAHGLNQSELYGDQDMCDRLLKSDNIKIFPDRQVVAMTGDGTNDAPALKRADIGFAMGISGTQLAKDAADIILLDDNFASIVTAAKWGRNIYASIQKFLQFQLTVNISAVITAIVGACAYQTSPLAAIQLLWVNLLMDSLASLALASEPPVDYLLEKPPVNRTEHMITKRMWVNMLGQSLYQVVVTMVLFFLGPSLLDVEAGHDIDGASIHYTIIFNAFVWMQLFNEINCRNLRGEFNVFAGIHRNALFCGILITTMGLQAIIVEFGSVAFRVSENGLSGTHWGLCMLLGVGSLPWQQVINLFYRLID